MRGRDRHGIQHLGHALRGGKAAGTRRDAETGRPPIPGPPVAPCRMLTKTLDVSSDCSNMDQLPNLHFAPVPRMPDL